MAQDAKSTNPRHGTSALHALKNPMVWLLAVPYFFMLTAGYGYTFWVPIVVRDTLHTTDSHTALVTASIAGVSMIVMTLVAISSDRRHERFYHAAASGVLIAVGFTGAALLPQPILRIASLGLVVIGSNMLLAPFWCLPAMILSGEGAAVGIALINSIGNFGGFVGPYAIGFLKDATGSNEGSFLGLAGCGVGVTIFCVVLRHSALGRADENPAARRAPEVLVT